METVTGTPAADAELAPLAASSAAAGAFAYLDSPVCASAPGSSGF